MAKKHSSYLYELNKIIGNQGHNQGARVIIEQRGYDDGQLRMYMSNAAQCGDDDDGEEYENVQVNTFPSTKPQVNKLPSTKPQIQSMQYESVVVGQATKQSTDAENNDVIAGVTKRLRKNRGYNIIATYICLTVLAVIAVTALAVGTSSFRESLRAQISIDAPVNEEDTSIQNSFSMNEISELNSQFTSIQTNISQLMSQLSSQQQQIESLRNSLCSCINSSLCN